MSRSKASAPCARISSAPWTGWTSRDRAAGRSACFRHVLDSVHLFALTSGNLSAADTASAVVKAWRAIQREVRRTPAPALFSISRAGEVRLLKA